jgi:hypothetical protein
MSCMRCLCGRAHVLYALSLWEDSCLVCVVFVGGLMSCMRCLCGRIHVLYALSLWEGSCLVCVVFVGGLMSCMRCLYLFACGGVRCILRYVFVLFFFVLCDLCCQFLWIVLFLFPFGILWRLFI